MGTTYVTRPAAWTGRHRRRKAATHRVGLAVLGAIWLGLGAFGTFATAGVVR